MENCKDWNCIKVDAGGKLHLWNYNNRDLNFDLLNYFYSVNN